MDRINSDKVSQSSFTYFTTEASDLGWPPGHWPSKVETDLGNGTPLRRVSLESSRGIYSQVDGDLLVVVYND